MYSIGQVLFVVLSKKNQVYPMQVIEVITKKTLGGEDVSYVLQAGSDKNSRIMLDQVDGEIFDSVEVAKKTLIQRATLQISKLIDIAVKKAVEWYNYNEGETSPQTIQDLPEFVMKQKPVALPQEADTTSVVMPDGTVVNVKLPEILRDHG